MTESIKRSSRRLQNSIHVKLPKTPKLKAKARNMKTEKLPLLTEVTLFNSKENSYKESKS